MPESLRPTCPEGFSKDPIVTERGAVSKTLNTWPDLALQSRRTRCRTLAYQNAGQVLVN